MGAEQAVIALDPIVRVLLGVVERAGEELRDRRVNATVPHYLWRLGPFISPGEVEPRGDWPKVGDAVCAIPGAACLRSCRAADPLALMNVCPVCDVTIPADGSQSWHAIAIASGMVAAQTECSIGEAIGLMQRRASAVDWTVERVADAVVARKMRFGPPLHPSP